MFFLHVLSFPQPLHKLFTKLPLTHTQYTFPLPKPLLNRNNWVSYAAFVGTGKHSRGFRITVTITLQDFGLNRMRECTIMELYLIDMGMASGKHDRAFSSTCETPLEASFFPPFTLYFPFTFCKYI